MRLPTGRASTFSQQENKAVIVWRGAANTGLVSSADRAYMKAPSLVLRRTYGYTPVKIEMGGKPF